MKKILFISFIMLSIGIIIGYTLPNREETSFYGEILEINNSTVHIQGIPENDINHRGEFILNISTKTKLMDNISLSNLQKNTLIKLTYSGSILESYPAQINDVTKIELAN